jgi:hypothetical protein
VIDPDHDVRDVFETEEEAIECMTEHVTDQEEEEAAERLSDLQSEMADMVSECEDESLLKRIKALLGA